MSPTLENLQLSNENANMKASTSTGITGLTFAVFMLFLCLAQPQLMAQSKAGTTVGQFLKIGPSARNAAIGSASASLSGEAIASFYNPASLGRLNNLQLQFTHSEWLADIDYNYLITGIPVGGLGTFALQLISLNSGEIDVRTVDQPLGTGERYSVTNFALGVAYGKMITERVAIGFQLNYLRETIWHSSLQAFGLNFGVQYRLWEGGPVFGAAISNFGPRTGYSGRDLFVDYDLDTGIAGDNDRLPAEFRTDRFALPTAFRAALSYAIAFDDNNSILLAAEALHPNDNTESINAGAEWKVLGRFFLRAGYRNLLLEDLEGGLTFGGGLHAELGGRLLSMDYAWGDYGLLNETQWFTLGFQF